MPLPRITPKRKGSTVSRSIAESSSTNLAAATPEGKAAEKLRRLKMEENSNLELAKDMLGLSSGSGIDAMIPVTKEEFGKFKKAVADKVTAFKTSTHYPGEKKRKVLVSF